MRIVWAIALVATTGAIAGTSIQSCVVHGQFKGIELYSWRLEGGKWAFAIVPGTNRNKTEDEIKQGQRCIHSLDQAKQVLSSLGQGDEVLWVQHPVGFKIPPSDVVKNIQATAARSGAKVILLSGGR